jgi:hypothetical protein
MKRVVAFILLGALLTVSLAPKAEAGGEGAIGLGVGIMVGVVLRQAIRPQPPVAAWPVYVVPGPPVYGPPPRWVPGYWQEQWAPATTQLQVWVPGHHDAYGHWTPSHYQTQIIQTGSPTRVWVPGHWE